MTKYTASDFADARFAEHGTENDPAVRRPDIKGKPWKCACGGTWSDEDMADMGWVPVPSKPTITESDLHRLTRNASDKYARGVNAGLLLAGAEVIPDPEPTNTEKLEQLIRESGLTISDNGIEGYAAELAASLDEDGVTAPNVKDN